MVSWMTKILYVYAQVVHQVKDDGNLKELYKANDDTCGWSMVDSSFESLLAGIVGEDVFEKFTTDHKYDYLQLMRDFDEKNRSEPFG